MHVKSVNEGWDGVEDNEKGNKGEGSSGEDMDEAHIILQVTLISKRQGQIPPAEQCCT